MDIETIVRKEMVKALVGRHIFDPFGGGQVLDVRTCVVVLDADGDPATVMSPETYTRLIEVSSANGVAPLGPNYSFDPDTIPA